MHRIGKGEKEQGNEQSDAHINRRRTLSLPTKKINNSARALLTLSAAEEDGAAPRLQRTVHAVELQSLETAAATTTSSSRAFPSSATEPSTSSPVVVINFSEGGSSPPEASLIVVQAPVGDANAAAVAAELARGIAESQGSDAAPSSVLLLAALRLPNASSSSSSKSSTKVFRGGDQSGFFFPAASSSSSTETLLLPRDARISDGFVSALALAVSLSLGPRSSRVALAAVDGHRPPVVPFSGSHNPSSTAVSAEEEGDAEALDAATALGEAAAEALEGGLKFSRARAARLVPSRAVLLEAAAAAASASPAGGAKASSAAPPLPLLQGAEQMYG